MSAPAATSPTFIVSPAPSTSAALRRMWASAAPLICASLDPSPWARALVGETSLSHYHANIYAVCSSPPPGFDAPQTHHVYALIRAQLHAHCRAVARIVADRLRFAEEARPPTPVVQGLGHAVVAARTEYLAHVLEGDEGAVQSAEISARDEGGCTDVEEGVEEDVRLLREYTRMWVAFSEGLIDVATLFSYVDRRWAPTRLEFGSDSLADDERRVLEPNPYVHDLRTTALLTWRSEVIAPLGSFLARAVMSCISADRQLRGASPCAEEEPQQGLEALCVLKPALDSFCTVGKCDVPRATALTHFPDGIPSTVASGLSGPAAFPDPLRPPSPEREEGVHALYRTLFETPFLSAAYRFYVDLSTERIRISGEDDSVRRYVREVDAYLEDELARVATYADESTMEPMRRVLERALIADHVAALHKEADVMFEEAAVHDLKSLYALLKRVPDGLRPVFAQLRAHVEAKGLKALRPWASYDSLESATETRESNSSWFPVYGQGASASGASGVSGGGAGDVVEVDVGGSGLPDGSPRDVGASGRRNVSSTESSLDALLPRTPAAGFVQAAWGLYSRYSLLASEAFGTDRNCTNSLEQGCERYLNSVRAAPELLAQFCHDILEGPIIVSPETARHSGRLVSTSEVDITEMSDHGASDGVGDAYRAGANEWISRVTRMFRFLNDKDVFQRVYSMKLTRRLVFRTSLSNDSERFMLGLLRETCGRDYTSRLQRMFADIASSCEETADFNSARLDGTVASHDVGDACVLVDALVLSSAAWPFLHQGQTASSAGPGAISQPAWAPGDKAPAIAGDVAGSSVPQASSSLHFGSASEVVVGSSTAGPFGVRCEAARSSDDVAPVHNAASTLALSALAALPTRIARLSASFVEFYGYSHPRHEGRKLQWLHHLSRVEVEAHIGVDTAKGVATMRLDASLPQAAILLQFNDHASLTVQSLCSILGVALSELVPTISVLLQAGVIRTDASLSFDDDDSGVVSGVTATTILSVNKEVEQWQRNRAGVVPLALTSYDGEDRARVRRTRIGIDTDRRQQVKACVVMFMKQLKRVDEAELVRLVVGKMARWFVVRESDVRASITVLVENEYLESDGDSYVYVA